MNIRGYRILRNQKGNAVTIAFLILIPLIVLAGIATLEHTRAVLGSDLDMQQAANDAVRSAALCVDPLSQAHDTPMIVPDKAHEAFRYILGANLGNECFDNIEYTLVVFNGKNHFGLPEGRIFSSQNPSGSDFSGTLPQEFGISGLNITPGGSGINTELVLPGCVAVVKSKLKPLIAGEQTGVRWSSAMVLQLIKN